MADYVMTIESDEEDSSFKIISKNDQEEAKLDPGFVFDLTGDPYLEFGSNILTEDLVKSGSKPVRLKRTLSETSVTVVLRLLYLWKTLLLGDAWAQNGND